MCYRLTYESNVQWNKKKWNYMVSRLDDRVFLIDKYIKWGKILVLNWHYMFMILYLVVITNTWEKKKEKYTQKKTDKGREEQPKKLSLQCLVRSCCFQWELGPLRTWDMRYYIAMHLSPQHLWNSALKSTLAEFQSLLKRKPRGSSTNQTSENYQCCNRIESKRIDTECKWNLFIM